MTDPDGWTPAATCEATRLFASNLNPKMAQRYFNLVLLPAVQVRACLAAWGRTTPRRQCPRLRAPSGTRVHVTPGQARRCRHATAMAAGSRKLLRGPGGSRGGFRCVLLPVPPLPQQSSTAFIVPRSHHPWSRGLRWASQSTSLPVHKRGTQARHQRMQSTARPEAELAAALAERHSCARQAQFPFVPCPQTRAVQAVCVLQGPAASSLRVRVHHSAGAHHRLSSLQGLHPNASLGGMPRRARARGFRLVHHRASNVRPSWLMHPWLGSRPYRAQVAILKLAEMPFSPGNALFLRTLLLKKYALPYRVVDALVEYFVSFRDSSEIPPVLWQQTLLAFVQHYKVSPPTLPSSVSLPTSHPRASLLVVDEYTKSVNPLNDRCGGFFNVWTSETAIARTRCLAEHAAADELPASPL